MKSIQIILFSLFLSVLVIEASADVRVDINNLEGRSFSAKFETQNEVDLWVESNISNDSWGKKQRWERYREQVTCLKIKDVMKEIDDVSQPYPDPEPENYKHPQVEVVSHQKCKMPVEYTIVQTDITKEEKEKRDEKKAAKEERKQVKRLIQNVKDSDLPQWHKRILKLYLNEIKE